MRRDRISRTLLLAVGVGTSSAAVSSHQIFERASTCATSTYTQCSQAGLPADFCCAPNTTCIPLAGNTTVLCCPTGNTCNTIQPLSCELQAQNATQNPSAALKTTALTGTLPTCGTGCCPFGYSCSNGGNCVMNADQSKAPATSSSSSSPTSSTSSNPISTISSITSPTTSTAPSTNTTLPLPEAQACSKFPVTAVLVGFFPGLILGILLTVASICLLGAQRRKASRRHSGSSFGNISDPQPSNGDMRTDFLRKPPQTPSTVATSSTPGRRNTVQRVRSLFQKSPPTQFQEEGAPPVPTMSSTNNGPVTPVLQREPSYGDINIFADGDTASALRERERQNTLGISQGGPRASHQTTFSDMMEKSGLAGLQKGQPYVYKGSEGYGTPPRSQRTP